MKVWYQFYPCCISKSPGQLITHVFLEINHYNTHPLAHSYSKESSVVQLYEIINLGVRNQHLYLFELALLKINLKEYGVSYLVLGDAMLKYYFMFP
jgi:hypothetical protein